MLQSNSRRFVSALLLVLILTTNSFSQGGENRVRFARGRTTAVLRGIATPRGEAGYTLGARVGQTMIVHLTSPGNAVKFTLYAVKGALLADDAADWQGRLPETNDYVILLSTAKSRANYIIEITIR